MKRVIYFLILLSFFFTIFALLPVVDGVTIKNGESYSSTDTVLPIDDGDINFYSIEATKDEVIEYSIKVQGSGTIQCYLCQGGVYSFGPSTEYYILYSEEENSREASEEMSISSTDGNFFTLVVITEEEYEVTYDIDIKVRDAAISSFQSTMICLTIIVIVLVLAIIGWITNKKKAKKAAAEQARMQQAHQQQHATTYQQLYGSTDSYDPYSTTQPQPQQPPQYPPQQPPSYSPGQYPPRQPGQQY
jgi:hypothetical protein